MNLPIDLDTTPEIEAIDLDVAEEAFVAFLEDMHALEGAERRREFVAWARDRTLWNGCGMIMEGWMGEIHREAYRYLRHDLDRPSPAKAWNDADPAVGRASIARMLSAPENVAGYVTAPFRTVEDDAGEMCIAAAIGIAPTFDVERWWDWTHLDIADVLLWNPAKNSVMVAGDHSSHGLIIKPDDIADRTVTVYADPLAFFRDWVARRALLPQMARVHGVSEPRDGGLPGALLIGPAKGADWLSLEASTIVAGPGTKRREIASAVIAAARIPRVLEAVVDRG